MLNSIFTLLTIALLGSSVLVAPAAAGNLITADPSSQSQPEIAKYQLAFFTSPTCQQCPIQKKIISQLSNELERKVSIRLLTTSVPSNREIFYSYGIRSVPALILTDAEGKEIKRLPPGVRSAEEIRNLLNHIP